MNEIIKIENDLNEYDRQLDIELISISSNDVEFRKYYTFDLTYHIEKVVMSLEDNIRSLIKIIKNELSLNGDFILYKDKSLYKDLIELKKKFEEIYPKINVVIHDFIKNYIGNGTTTRIRDQIDPEVRKIQKYRESDTLAFLMLTRDLFTFAIKNINEILETFQPYLDRKLSLQERSLRVVKANPQMIPSDHEELVQYYITNAENALKENTLENKYLKYKTKKPKTSLTIGGKTKRKNKHIKKTMKKKYRKKL